MRFDNDAQPLPLLLRADCVFCHTGQMSPSTLDRPRVLSTSNPTYTWGDTTSGSNTTLAGGNFFYVNLQDYNGHNVRGVSGQDGILFDIPPGSPGGLGLPSDGNPSPQLQCAGVNGCHGDSTISTVPLNSLGSAHHTNATGVDIDGTSVGKSYRFLNGVLGWEDDDWEFTSSSTDHNRYVGEDRANSNLPASATTISGFCARCHGDFHNITSGGGTTGISNSDPIMSSPWLRHPIDYDMAVPSDFPATSDYANYAAYDTRVPVARISSRLSANGNDAVANDQAIIMCLTCHRAHGSPNHSSLRWNYRAWPQDDPITNSPQDGCQICHTSKS